MHTDEAVRVLGQMRAEAARYHLQSERMLERSFDEQERDEWGNLSDEFLALVVLCDALLAR